MSAEDIDARLVANAEPEIAVALKNGDTAKAKEVALQLLRVVSTPKSLRTGFFLLLDAFCSQGGKPESIDSSVGACLGGFAGSDPLRPSATYYAALYCYEKERYASALKGTAAVLSDYPDDRKWAVPARMLQALCEIRLEKYKEALQTLSAVVAAAPTSEDAPKAQFLMAWVYMFTQENDKARSALTVLLDKYPNTPYTAKARQFLANLGAPP